MSERAWLPNLKWKRNARKTLTAATTVHDDLYTHENGIKFTKLTILCINNS